MAKEPASVQLTGGAGFEYEDQVAAFFASAMLAGTQPLGPGIGGVVKLDWQTRESGWLLDDLLITLARPSKGRLACSIKSDKQVTSSGFPPSFVTLAWEQWLARGTPASTFDKNVDLLGLIVGELASEPREDWNELLRQALVTDPPRLAKRYTTKGISSEGGRAFFASLKCSASIPTTPLPSAEETAALVKRIRLVHLDFTSPTSRDLGESVFTLQRTLVSGSPDEAKVLWERLCRLSTVRRAGGGSLSREELVGELRGTFCLRDTPVHDSQWGRLQRLSADYAGRVKLTVGGELRLDRDGQLAQLQARMTEKAAVLVTGTTGCGKSALARLFAEDNTVCSRFLWLDSEIVGDRTPGELEAHLGLDVPFQALLSESSPALSVIILDGLDRFSPKGLSSIAALISSLTKPLATSGWVLIATARTEASAELRARIHQAGLPDFSIWSLPLPSRATIQSALDQIPALTHLATRPSLVDALRNLKVLDWVASVALTSSQPVPDAWVGHMDVLDWVWQAWLGSAPGQLARASALKTLGVLDADQLLAGVGLMKTKDLGNPVLEDLQLLDLIRLTEERVYFTHDLVGDVSRLRILIETQDNKTELLTRAQSPRWHSAIRFLGQRLAERTTPTDRAWRRVFDMLDDETTEGALCRNLLVEGVSLAANADQLIELLWTDLCADEGPLLRRFLEGFRYVATIPDPRLEHLNAAPEARADLEANVRVPYWPYWIPVLGTLAKHTPDLCRLAPVEAGQLVGLWLRTMPIGTEGRREAAVVALTLGKEIQAARAEHFRAEREEETVIFEAVLNASPELPEEIARLTLELAQRRPEPASVTERRERYQEEERRRQEEWDAKNPSRTRRGTSPIFTTHEVRSSRHPDGPAARVDSGFQTTILGGQAICTLAMARPEAAREVLLACSLRPPHSLRFGEDYDPLNRHGIESAERDRPPFFSNGPWLSLLRQNPSLTVDVIVRLVNYATRNWAATDGRFSGPDRLEITPPTINVRWNGANLTWTGDSRVFAWYRNLLIGSETIACSLMALERWLYDQVDAGKSVEPIVEQVWNTSTSVAFLGVLTALALRHPELLDGPLAPLLGVWQLDEWSYRLLTNADVWRFELMLWQRYGELATREAVTWNTLPHRQLITRQQFTTAFLTRPAVRAAFDDIRERWQNEAALCPESAPAISRVSALFDIDNYDLTDQEDGTIKIAFDWPQELRAETTAQSEHARKSLAFLSFPHRCRELLNKTSPLLDSEAESLWKEMQDLSTFELKSEREAMLGPARRKEDVIAGGITVLAVLAPAWLESHSEMAEWCAEQLLRITAHPPPSGPLDIPESVSTDAWHVFLAEFAIHELAGNPDNLQMRWWAAWGVMSRWHSTTRLAMQAAYRLRERLGEEFTRLVNLAALWAALNGTRYHYEETDSERKRHVVRYSRLVSAFGRRTIHAERLNWTEVGRISREAYQRVDKKRFPLKYAKPEPGLEDKHDDSVERALTRAMKRRARTPRHYPGYDLQVLVAAFGWLPEALATTGPARQLALNLVQDLLSVSTGMLPDTEVAEDDDDDMDGFPYEFDRWVFDIVAQVVPQLDASEVASQLWRPILELGPRAHYWVEDFLNAWGSTGLQKSPSPERFFTRWNEMISFAENSPVWNPERGEAHHRLGGLWTHLLGMELTAPVIAAEENERFLATMTPVYERWAGRWLNSSWALRDFCRFLLKPGSKRLRLKAIPWLNSALDGLSDYRSDREDVDVLAVRVLRSVWSENSLQIATDAELKRAFLELVTLLAAGQVADALHLRDAVAKAIPLS